MENKNIWINKAITYYRPKFKGNVKVMSVDTGSVDTWASFMAEAPLWVETADTESEVWDFIRDGVRSLVHVRKTKQGWKEVNS